VTPTGSWLAQCLGFELRRLHERKSTIITGDGPMTDATKSTETTDVKTETKRDSDGALNSEYKKETTVKTERTVEKEKEPIIIIEER
jgi:hypothetical protein